MKKEYYLVVQFNTYAGNYMNSLGTWLTGYDDEYGVSSEESIQFKENFPEFDLYDVIELTTTEYGEKVFDFFESTSTDLAMKFCDEPSKEVLEFFLERINSYPSVKNDSLELDCYLLVKNIECTFIKL